MSKDEMAEQAPPTVPLFGLQEVAQWSFYRALIAELIATFLLLYVSILTVIGHNSQVSSGNACAGVGILGVASAFGGMVFILVYCISDISGGHMNPAVTFGQLLARKVSLIRAVMYMVAQCLGAICGCGLVKLFQETYHKRYGGGANKLVRGYNKGAGLGAEVIGTFLLVYTVFSATDPKRNSKNSVLAPFSIGFVVFVIHLATIPITGTGINPARSFGAAVIYNRDEAWIDQWIFWVGPFIGASIAVLYHQFIMTDGANRAYGSSRSNA